jgi:hypothetical protein
MTPCVGVGPGFFGVGARPVIFASSLCLLTLRGCRSSREERGGDGVVGKVIGRGSVCGSGRAIAVTRRRCTVRAVRSRGSGVDSAAVDLTSAQLTIAGEE